MELVQSNDDLRAYNYRGWHSVNENSINYCAEEISEREYLIAIGEIDEDE